MQANKTQNNSNYKSNVELVSEWVHTATLYSIIDMWTQDSQYNGEKTSKRKATFRFEIPSIMSDFGKWEQPVAVSMNNVTLSMHEKGKMRPMIEKIIWKKLSDTEAELFDLSEILGKNVQVVIEHNGEYCNIQSFLTYKWKPIKAINEPYILDLDAFDQKVFDKLWEKTKEKIMATPERIEICKKTEKEGNEENEKF